MSSTQGVVDIFVVPPHYHTEIFLHVLAAFPNHNEESLLFGEEVVPQNHIHDQQKNASVGKVTETHHLSARTGRTVRATRVRAVNETLLAGPTRAPQAQRPRRGNDSFRSGYGEKFGLLCQETAIVQ